MDLVNYMKFEYYCVYCLNLNIDMRSLTSLAWPEYNGVGVIVNTKCSPTTSFGLKSVLFDNNTITM